MTQVDHSEAKRLRKVLSPARARFLIGALLLASGSTCVLRQSNSNEAMHQTKKLGAGRDGQHDFDFTLGTWKTHISRLQHPLPGSTTWFQLEGTKVALKVWGGRAVLEEIEADGPAGHWEASLSFSIIHNPTRGALISPTARMVRSASRRSVSSKMGAASSLTKKHSMGTATFVWSDITPNSHRFEQSFSDDGGKTWEPNFIAVLTREEAAQPTADAVGIGDSKARKRWPLSDVQDKTPNAKSAATCY